MYFLLLLFASLFCGFDLFLQRITLLGIGLQEIMWVGGLLCTFVIESFAVTILRQLAIGYKVLPHLRGALGEALGCV